MFIITWSGHKWYFDTKELQTSFKDFWKLRGECRCFEVNGSGRTDEIEVTETL